MQNITLSTFPFLEISTSTSTPVLPSVDNNNNTNKNNNSNNNNNVIVLEIAEKALDALMYIAGFNQRADIGILKLYLYTCYIFHMYIHFFILPYVYIITIIYSLLRIFYMF